MNTTWRQCTIGDVCDTISNTYNSNAQQVVLINTSDVLEGKVLNHIYIPNENLKGQFKKTFEEGDILYSEIRPQNKRYAYIDFAPINYIASTKLMVIRNKNIVKSKYLYYFLQSDKIISELQMLAETRSGTFPQITFNELSKLSIKIPPLPEQDRIISILDSICKKIDINQQINDNLEEQAKALFKSWFVDNQEPTWEKKTLADIVNIWDSMRKPLSATERDKMQKIYPYYGATSLMDYVDNYLFDGIYLLMGEDGTVVDDKGFPILQYVYGKFWVNNHAHVLTGANGFSTECIYILLSTTNVKSIVTGAVQPKINQANLKNIPIVIPPEDVLSDYKAIIHPLFAKIRNNSMEIHRLTIIHDTLLPKLMSGELSVEEVSFD